MTKAERQAKKDERHAKLLDDLINGRTVIAPIEVHEPKKKKQQANRKGGAAPDENTEGEMLRNYERLLRLLLPGIIIKLSQIDDPRDPGKVIYSLPFLMLYGILMFISQCTSRREANRSISHENLLNMVNEFIPGVAEMPHADTLMRLLCNINIEEIDKYYVELIKGFIASNQFKEVQTGRYRVAIDGTQKFSRRYEWDGRALHQHAGDEEKERYYVYALESALILDNGMTLPLLTEILENKADEPGNPSKTKTKDFCTPVSEGDKSATKAEKESERKQKQDCETKAFHRLAGRLDKLLGKGCVTLVMDGIYACGPVISRCNEYGWDYMIVLKNECLKTVWEDFNGLRKIESKNTLYTLYGERQQEYHWSNRIDYTYGNNHKTLLLNLVTCTETWTEEHPRSGKRPKKMKTQYAWLSSKHVTTSNAFELCTVIARSRWRIENLFLMEKHQGYNYTHCYSYNWNAMKGFHYLMKFGVFINVLTVYSEGLSAYAQVEGMRGLIQKIWSKINEGKWPLHEICESKNERTIVASQRKIIKFPPLIKAA